MCGMYCGIVSMPVKSGILVACGQPLVMLGLDPLMESMDPSWPKGFSNGDFGEGWPLSWEGLPFAKDCVICIQISEVDATRVVQAVNCGDSLAEEGAVINNILELFSVSLQWSCYAICREANRVAHCLVASMFILENEVYVWDKVPRFVTLMVLADLAY
ncbi:hypothetical protein TIFTF001_047933 [Ficus carica]|uniref:Uncharacterized protein n=1 Tax=Ficus carica TaxID=3494 RepID=A0AA87ZAR7_FICCA|nr:hypothetical protein TIFTF001_047933 [Ficus carica]